MKGASADPATRGGLTADEVGRYIRLNRGDIKACYLAELACSTRYGSVRTLFVIGPHGAPIHVDVSEGDLPMPRVRTCIARYVAGWRFPPPRGGGAVVVSYPFIFKDGNPSAGR